MDRPYIICHMETALDGKITGPYMDTPTLFERRPGDDFSGSVSFTLKGAEAAKDGCVWLRYLAKR